MASSLASHGQDIDGDQYESRRQPDRSRAQFHIGDVVEKKVSPHGVRQAEVLVDADSSGPYMLEHLAGRGESWDDVTSLSLALVEPEGDDYVTETPMAHRGYAGAMMEFFYACCKNVVELNLTAFHFAVEVGCGVVVASQLPSLRFLAVVPCAVNHRPSLDQLAWYGKPLEVLDVVGERTSSCEVCHLPLGFSALQFQNMDADTKLRRLIVGETANVQDLSFLEGCRVRELRLNVNCENVTDLPGITWTLGELLRQNSRLTKCSLGVTRETLGARFARDLSMVRSLKHLCVMATARTTDREANYFLSFLKKSLPHLLSLHAHWPDTDETVRTMTWHHDSIILPDSPSNGNLWCQTRRIEMTGH